MAVVTRSRASALVTALAYDESATFLELNEETLRRLENNDPDLVHLKIYDYYYGYGDQDQMIEGVGRAIGGSIYLSKLKLVFVSELFENPLLEEVCRGLARNRSIRWLTLTNGIARNLRVDIFDMLAPFFEQNKNLVELEIVRMDPESPQFRALPAALKKCQHLESVRLDELYGDNHEEIIPAVIRAINTDRLVSLYYTNTPIDVDGCKEIARLITSPHSNSKQFTDLFMSNNDLDEECVFVLINAIREKGFASFSFSDNAIGTDLPWCFFFTTVLRDPFCSVHCLRLNGNSIGDEGAHALGKALRVNKSVSHLDISDNPAITIEGWKLFSRGLSCSVLEFLDIRFCDMYDESALRIIKALKHNACLATLMLDADDITDIMWTTLSRVLWDTSSLENTYLSNHTLCELVFSIRNEEIGDELVSDAVAKASKEVQTALMLNDNNDKVGVSRQKILLRHLRDAADTPLIIIGVPETTLPFALAWIGQDKWGYSLMYNVVQNLTELFDPRNNFLQPAAAKKRKVRRSERFE